MSAHISRRALAQHVVDRLMRQDISVLPELAAYIIDERLTRQIDLIINEIEAEYAARGQVVADVTSARQLDASARRELEQFIAQATGANSVELREKQNAELIGGVVIETPGKYFDSSIKSQLNQLKVKA